MEKEGCESIKVLVRIRPAAQGDTAGGCVTFGLDGSSISVRTGSGVGRPGTPKGGGSGVEGDLHSFKFDHVAQGGTSQLEVFEKVGAPACDAFLDGFNSAVFAYGQTGSGKTFTMFGDLSGGVDAGLIPRCLRRIFERTQAFEDSGCVVSCSCTLVEIYNEQVLDLLVSNASPSTPTAAGTPSLQLRTDGPKGTVHIEGAASVPAQGVEQVMGLLRQGAARRTVGETSANERSSRSHSIFSLRLSVDEPSGTDRLSKVVRRSSVFHLVDLAGSERQRQSNSAGLRLKEAGNINRSLSALGNVIMALADGQPHVPYRDSKLTFLLRDSIGGNSKTFMVSNASAAAQWGAETLSTLKFSSFAKRSKLVARRNVTEADSTVDELQEEVRRLQSLLHDSAQTPVAPHTRTWLFSPPADSPLESPLSQSGGLGGGGGDGGGARRLGLLRQALDREEGLRERLAKERARYRVRLEEYDRVVQTLSHCLEDAKGHFSMSEGDSTQVLRLRMRVGVLEAEVEELRGRERADENVGLEQQLASLSEEIRVLIHSGGYARGGTPPSGSPGEIREVEGLRARVGELEREGRALMERLDEMRAAEDDMCITVDEMSAKLGDAERAEEAHKEVKRLFEELERRNGMLECENRGNRDKGELLERECQALRGEVQGHEAMLVCAEEGMKDLRGDVCERDAKVGLLQGLLGERDAELAEAKRVLGERDAELAEAKRVLGERDAEAGRRVGRDAELGEAKNLLSAMDADNLRLSGLLSDIEAECRRLTDELSGRDADCERLEGLIALHEAELLVKSAEIAHLSGLPHSAGPKARGLEDVMSPENIQARRGQCVGELERVKALTEALERQREHLEVALALFSCPPSPVKVFKSPCNPPSSSGQKTRVALRDAGTRGNKNAPNNDAIVTVPESSRSPAKSPVKGAHGAFHAIMSTTQRLLEEISMSRATVAGVASVPVPLAVSAQGPMNFTD